MHLSKPSTVEWEGIGSSSALGQTGLKSRSLVDNELNSRKVSGKGASGPEFSFLEYHSRWYDIDDRAEY